MVPISLLCDSLLHPVRTEPLLLALPRGITLLFNGFENVGENVEAAAVDLDPVATVGMVAVIGLEALLEGCFVNEAHRLVIWAQQGLS